MQFSRQPRCERPKHAPMKEIVSHPAFTSRVAARIEIVEEELRAAVASDQLAIPSVREHETTQPLTLLRDRLQLTPSEESVLWTLIAHQLSATVRTLVRDLDGERPSD